jgi:rhodanese-related sulfurtransferase
MAQAMENIKNDPSIRLVDVRSPEEYREGHIPGSLSIPLDSLSRVQSLIPDKATTLYTYCASGARSGMAVGMLGRMGYSAVKNIGGIMSYPGKLER